MKSTRRAKSTACAADAQHDATDAVRPTARASRWERIELSVSSRPRTAATADESSTMSWRMALADDEVIGSCSGEGGAREGDALPPACANGECGASVGVEGRRGGGGPWCGAGGECWW